jgi:acetyl-CoA carboxylase carboxyl transferase subunit alpha
MAGKYILEFEKPIMELEKKIEEMRSLSGSLNIGPEIEYLEKKVDELRVQIHSELTRWQRVQIARHPERPTTLDFINNVFTDFMELHGDKHFRDDPAIVGGIAMLGEHAVMLVGQQKGKDTKSNLLRNFGMSNPEGYRKARRLFELAEKFGKPIITFLDTPGAYPGIEAEERGQAEAIARNIYIQCNLRVPIIVVIIGEGASGGAIGIGIGDRMLMLENAWYSVISPESCSSILWRSWDFKEQAAEALRLSASDLLEQKIIDEIVKEPTGGAHKNPNHMYEILRSALHSELNRFKDFNPDELVAARQAKFMSMGAWTEEN